MEILVLGQNLAFLKAEELADEEAPFCGADRWGVLKEVEVGARVAEVIRKAGISEQTFYPWKEQCTGLESDQVPEMKLLQEENSWLKQMVVELSLDKTVLQDVLRNKW